MEKRKFEKLNAEVSLLGFGLMRLTLLEDGKLDYKKAERLIDMALEGGVNYFDTAWPYLSKQSELFIGDALVKRHPRDKYYIATKLPSFLVSTADKIEQFFNDHFERMKTDYIDFYLMHSISWESWQKLKSFGIIEFIEKQRADGKIRSIGFSTHDKPAGVEKIVADYEWDFAQIQMNYMDWEDLDIKSSYAALEKAGLPVVVMEPIRGGGLAKPDNPGVKKLMELLPNQTPSALALRWAAGHKNVKVVLSGMNEIQQMEENLKTFEKFQPLNDEESAAIDESIKAIKSLPIIPCTSCEYCKDCPNKINIPSILQKYNSYIMYDSPAPFLFFYAGAHPPGQSAADCVECGSCVKACPQKIDIPARLKEIAALHKKITEKK